MSKEKPKPVVQDFTHNQCRVWISPEVQHDWADLAGELYDWLKARFETPAEGFAFLHFAVHWIGKYLGFKKPNMIEIETYKDD